MVSKNRRIHLNPSYDQKTGLGQPTQFCKKIAFWLGLHPIHSFKNWHVSHTEFFNVGQPRLARYPIHWHHAGYVGERGGYADPSSAESNSIHDSFSRWITIHGTHEAIVKDNVGYNCVGHGFFMEDGYEEQNLIQGQSCEFTGRNH